MANQKLAKFGEVYDIDNTEPSRIAKGVETRRRVKLFCKNCGKQLRGQQQKYCSNKCLAIFRRKTKVPLIECIQCQQPIIDKPANAKYCSKTCRARAGSYRWAIKNKIKLPGVGSGNAQNYGKLHHSYKNGRKNFRQKALVHYGKRCHVCKKQRKLDVHHKDFDVNQDNNELSNLIVLCRSCHKKVHSGKITLKV